MEAQTCSSYDVRMAAITARRPTHSGSPSPRAFSVFASTLSDRCPALAAPEGQATRSGSSRGVAGHHRPRVGLVAALAEPIFSFQFSAGVPSSFKWEAR